MNIVEEKDQSSDSSVPSLQAIDTLEELLSTPISHRRLEAVPSETLHRLLTEVDPSCAGSLHPHNRRMVIRALQRCTRAPVANKGGATCSPSSVDQVDRFVSPEPFSCG